MSGREFAIHFQDHWMEKAGNPKLPLWLRVAAYAYGTHAANGHASFNRGEVRDVLSKIDVKNRLPVQPDDANISRAIRTAVEYGWLDPRSTMRCLVVPAHQIEKRTKGQHKSCPLQRQHEAQHGRRLRDHEPRHLRVVEGVGS